MVPSRMFLMFLIMCFSANVACASYIPYNEQWGIYELNSSSGEIRLLLSSPNEITKISFSPKGDELALSMNLGEGYEHSEIFILDTNGNNLKRLTKNNYWDLYPVWSPDGKEIAYLSWRNSTLDIYKMDADGSSQRLFYDSGGHDADIDWRGTLIAFTRDSQIWLINSDGSNPHRVTRPERAGEWGNAPLPFGDYDPRISPDGSMIVFERLVNDSSPHGNYDLYIVDTDSTNEHALTHNSWTQGIACWSSDGEKLIYLVSAVGTEGRYDIYSINVDGTNMTDITSELFPSNFLAFSPITSTDDSSIYFIGEWWDWTKLETTLTLSSSKKILAPNQTLTLTGSINPIISKVNITITITGPDGSETIKRTTSENGSYTFSFSPEHSGEWKAVATWGGDLGHYESTSELVNFKVQESKTMDSTFLPSFSASAIFIGLLAFIYYSHRLKYQNDLFN